jgi:hypothetical protein
MMKRGREGGGERERNARGEESCKRERERVEVTWLSFFKKTQPGRKLFSFFFFFFRFERVFFPHKRFALG